MRYSGAQLVIRALREEGIRFSFGIPGTHNIELYDELVEQDDIYPILVTDEQSASFMADGVARASGEIAAVNVVPGAGLTHTLSGIAEAFLDQIPLLILACGIRKDTGAAYQLHDVDQAAIAGPVCKKVFQPNDHGELYRNIREACTLAKKAPQGPVMVEVPANLYLLLSDLTEKELQFRSAPQKKIPEKKIDPQKIEKIVQALNESKSIAIYAGLGVQEAHEPLIRLAEKLDAIVFTTISGKGVFPEDHPRWAWSTIGSSAPKEIREIEKICDCLLTIGGRFAEVATGSYGLKAPEKLIHIDIDPEVFNRNYPAQLTLAADAKEAIEALLEADLQKREPIDASRLEALAHAHDKIRKKQSEKKPTYEEKVSPSSLFSSLQEVFGPETIFVTDSGNGTFLAMEHLQLSRPHSFLGPVDYSCMGYSVPAAIGAKLASPQRPVVALVGDGAFLMTGMELLTAANYQVGVITCILNDGKLSQIAQFQKSSLNRETCSTLPPIEWGAMAQSLGINYLKIATDDDLKTMLAEAREISTANRPVLIEVAIDYSQPTFFSQGVVKTNFLRFPWKDRFRLVGRVLKRKIARKN